jgi:hypothetical protein
VTLRNYSNTSVQTTLTTGIDDTVTILIVADATGYPAVPFAIVVDPDVVASEEVVLVTAKVGPIFTVTRGYDSTTAKAHSAGASVIHAAIAADLADRLIPSTYATDSLTIAVQPTAGDTITVGGLDYTYIDGVFANPGEILIGADLAEAQANTVIAIGASWPTLPNAGALPFSANVSVLVAAVAGVAGNGVVTTGTFTDGANFFGQASLSGGTDGTDTGHVAAQTGAFTGASTASAVVSIQAAPGMDYASSQQNMLVLRDKNGDQVLRIDSGGNFYTLRDLRLLAADNGAVFVAGADGHVVFRVADISDAYQVRLAGGSGDQVIFSLRPNAGRTALINSHAAGAVALEIDTAGIMGDNTDLIRAHGTVDYNLVFRLMQGGAVVIAQHTAPDDADLNTGDMALWFDQTPGAAAMMIKAKDSGGTVVTNSVPLT